MQKTLKMLKRALMLIASAAILLLLLVGCASESTKELNAIEAEISGVTSIEGVNDLIRKVKAADDKYDFDEKESEHYEVIKRELRCKYGEIYQESMKEEGVSDCKVNVYGSDKNVAGITFPAMSEERALEVVRASETLWVTLGFKEAVIKEKEEGDVLGEVVYSWIPFSQKAMSTGDFIKITTVWAKKVKRYFSTEQPRSLEKIQESGEIVGMFQVTMNMACVKYDYTLSDYYAEFNKVEQRKVREILEDVDASRHYDLLVKVVKSIR